MRSRGVANIGPDHNSWSWQPTASGRNAPSQSVTLTSLSLLLNLYYLKKTEGSVVCPAPRYVGPFVQLLSYDTALLLRLHPRPHRTRTHFIPSIDSPPPHMLSPPQIPPPPSITLARAARGSAASPNPTWDTVASPMPPICCESPRAMVSYPRRASHRHSRWGRCPPPRVEPLSPLPSGAATPASLQIPPRSPIPLGKIGVPVPPSRLHPWRSKLFVSRGS